MMDELYNAYKNDDDSDSENEAAIGFEFSNLEKKLKSRISETNAASSNATTTNQLRKRKLENVYGPVYDNSSSTNHNNVNDSKSIHQKSNKKREPVMTFSRNVRKYVSKRKLAQEEDNGSSNNGFDQDQLLNFNNDKQGICY